MNGGETTMLRASHWLEPSSLLAGRDGAVSESGCSVGEGSLEAGDAQLSSVPPGGQRRQRTVLVSSGSTGGAVVGRGGPGGLGEKR